MFDMMNQHLAKDTHHVDQGQPLSLKVQLVPLLPVTTLVSASVEQVGVAKHEINVRAGLHTSSVFSFLHQKNSSDV